MVMAPQEAIRSWADLRHDDPHQRRLLRLKAAAAIVGQQLLPARPLLIGGQIRPVFGDGQNRHVRMHNLQRSVEPFPNERCPQERVSLSRPLPGLREGVEIDVPFQ